MKTNVTLCFDVNVAEELQKEKNKSAMLNSYLINYYGLNKSKEEEVEDNN